MGGQETSPYLVSSSSLKIRPQSPFSSNAGSSLYPKIQSEGRTPAAAAAAADMASGSANSPVGAFEELLVTIPGALVHLVDDQESVLLASGDFSIVRINQQNQRIVVLVRAGDSLQWPLVSDEQVVKLDSIHYVFSLPMAPTLDEAVDGIASEAVSTAQGGEKIHYGVTFAAQGQEEDLRLLDDLLESYSFFSSPSLVHGDKQKETVERHLASKDDLVVDARDATVVPASVVTGNGKQITEENQRIFWTAMAPNVDDYGNSLAKAIASGTGQIIRGIFWVRDSTVRTLESGSINVTRNSKPTDHPSDIRPSTLRNLQRVNFLSKATDDFAKSVLSGVISTVGIIPNAIIRSSVGRAILKTAPGEVALASMISFWKLFDAVEQASRDVLKTGTAAAATVVTHKYGEPAGTATGQTLGTAGHMVGTAWSVAKIPKAFNPTAALKPSKATIMALNSPKLTK
jgi:spartin